MEMTGELGAARAKKVRWGVPILLLIGKELKISSKPDYGLRARQTYHWASSTRIGSALSDCLQLLKLNAWLGNGSAGV